MTSQDLLPIESDIISSSPSEGSSFSRTTTVVDDGSNEAKGSLGLTLLHCPSEALVDFVFVHGLGGGSRKTWSKTSSVSHFWPQQWLPEDSAFKQVRTHSFGYNSDWAKGKDNCLNVHHFGKSLLGELSTSPQLASSDTSIVLIGHSMGGLVIKKAFILAKQQAAHTSLAGRLHSIYFLATPHRGSDSAKLLTTILQFAYSSRAYVDDLERNSAAIQVINDEFRHYSGDVNLWSFYETKKLEMGMLSRLIVDPDSAVLGYPEEKQMPMNADHRSICKFDAPTDPNFLILRNAMASTVEAITRDTPASNTSRPAIQLKDLRKYLGVSDTSEDDLITVQEARLLGTCDWFTTKGSYTRWRDSITTATNVFWVNGKPATGKSVLSGSIVNDLKTMKRPCSYFFFKHGDRAKSKLATCLRSLTLQMARAHASVLDRIVAMARDEVDISDGNELVLWRKLFSSGVFEARFPTHYWVIDALDECTNCGPLLESMLAKLDPSIPLRVLITSRDSSQLHNLFGSLATGRHNTETVTTTDTRADIKRLVKEKAQLFNVEGDDEREVLVNTILEKSQGSFLWTVLVLRELAGTYSEVEAREVLDNVPPMMEALYTRTLQAMSRMTRGKRLATAILTWTTCSTRALTVKELDGALRLDIKEAFTKLEDSINALCGQLVVVDIFGKVQMVHETAREFLLDDEMSSEFTVCKSNAHTQLARVCLTYLTGDEMRPPRTNRRGFNINPANKRAEFSIYASNSVFYHLSKANPLENDVLHLVDTFLSSNILSWIENIAKAGNMGPLIRAAKHLKAYATALSAERSPLVKEMRKIRNWTTDLIRLAAKFAGALITSPPSIFSLVPPLCPTESAVYKISSTTRKISVLGLSSEQWDDRLSCIDFRQGQNSAICHGEELFAIGSTSGVVALYHIHTCQEYRTLDHGESVKMLLFKGKSSLLVSCGMRWLTIWDVRTGQALHNLDAPHRPIALDVLDDIIMVASYKNYLALWDLSNTATRLPDRPWNDHVEDSATPSRGQPSAISISIPHKMLSIAYNGRPITLWDLEGDAYYGSTGKKLLSGDTSTHMVTALIFNPNPIIELLAVSYLDGELVLLDPFSDQEIGSCRANCPTLSASPDGRLLAGAPGNGIIHIYEFDTLRLLYRVRSTNIFVRSISFSKDSFRFADIRGSQCNIWEPAALLRDTLGDESSVGTSASIVDAVSSDSRVKITAMILPLTGGVAFVGKDDGSIGLYDLKTGIQRQTLYRQKSAIRLLAWSSTHSLLVSVDMSNAVAGWKLTKSPKEGWAPNRELFQFRLDCGGTVMQVLLCETQSKLILSARGSDHLWNLDAIQERELKISDASGVRKWLQHPASPAHLICAQHATFHVHKWSDCSRIASIPLLVDVAGLQLKRVLAYNMGMKHRVLIEMSEIDGSADTLALHLLEDSTLGLADTQAGHGTNQSDGSSGADAVLVPVSGSPLDTIAKQAAHVLSVDLGRKLVFLDKRSWVCSVDLDGLGANSGLVSYYRHFFAPHDWFAGIRDVIGSVAGKDVIFARNDDVVIVKGGLDFIEKVDIAIDGGVLTSGQRTSLLTVPHII